MDELLVNDDLDIQRKRLSQIYHYLEALNQVRNPVKRLINEQQWLLWIQDLPENPSIEIARYTDAEDNGEEAELSRTSLSEIQRSDFILKVKRPKLTDSPPPPDELKEWILRGWEEYGREVNHHESINRIDEEGNTYIEEFYADEERIRIYDEWLLKREQWQENERPARAAMGVFEDLYKLHMLVEREAERLEVVIGEGLLGWQRSDGDVYHPVLLQRLQLKLNPDIPEIALYETDHPLELYSALFRTMNDVDGRELGNIREELSTGFYHPMGGETTTSFLRRLSLSLSPRGKVVDDIDLQGISSDPVIARKPVIFLRARTLGYSSALETIISSIEEEEAFAASLLDIVGLHKSYISDEVEEKSEVFRTANEDSEILFSKPANDEQLQIAKRLLRHSSVLVQGPPGTGKSHTIANLIGHLLAQGKSILVTSYSTKALRVLRDHVVEDIRPLCVSVLDRDEDSKNQLESSINSIVEKLSGGYENLEKQAALLAERRRECLEQISRVREQILEAMQNEYRDLSIDGRQLLPSDAAREVSDGTGKDDWIPGTIKAGEPLPLSVEEIEMLYRTNILLTSDDEVELQNQLPPMEMLVGPEEFNEHSKAVRRKDREVDAESGNYWSKAPREQDQERLRELLQRIIDNTRLFGGESDWVAKIVDAGRRGGVDRQSWESLISIVREIDKRTGYIREINLRFKPTVSEAINLETQLNLLNEMIEHIKKSRQLSRLTLMSHKDWRQFLGVVRVRGRQPQTVDDFVALRDVVVFEMYGKNLIERWDYQLSAISGPTVRELGNEYQEACLQLCETIQKALDWYEGCWVPLREEIVSNGLLWKAMEEEEKDNGQYGELNIIRRILKEKAPDVINSRINEISACVIEDLLNDLEKQIREYHNQSSSIETIEDICKAIKERDSDKYRALYMHISKLHGKMELYDRRRELLDKLERVAPKWAERIRGRIPPDDIGEPPGDVRAAWAWLQMKQELDSRSSISLETLQEKSCKLSIELQDITGELISRSAWAAQVKRTTPRQRQSLVGWLHTVRKIGKGTGKRVPRLRAEARMRMNESQSAVPVWIMPLSRVVENFDPAKVKFDIVIIDEASQCDVMALIALYMGKQVIIVGDDKQVSPEAVGQKVEEIQHLIDEHLLGIPNANLYDGQMSVYDLALQSFGGSICLLEHFRCVPEIINFSNILCYNGRIKPLRDSSKTDLRPYVVPYYLDRAFSRNKINTQEALATASLLLAAMKRPEYDQKTFGVISLVGEEQAQEVEKILRKTLSPNDFEKRRILCGNPAHFQGDERDVIFITMVDGPEGGPLRQRTEERFRKRYNVAASRAKDQMWLIYSLDAQKDLKPDDLRKQLIQFALDPKTFAEALYEGQSLTESEFEKQVYTALISRGYKVIPQYKVGYYRIDMVVESNNSRLAIECDGDRFHPLEKLEEDMARQAVLERLGWTFLRIRGSEYFRNPNKTMERVLQKLEEYEIFPEAKELNELDLERETSELLDSIIREAAAIRGEWDEGHFVEHESSGTTMESKSRRQRREVTVSFGEELAEETRKETKEKEPLPIEVEAATVKERTEEQQISAEQLPFRVEEEGGRYAEDEIVTEGEKDHKEEEPEQLELLDGRARKLKEKFATEERRHKNDPLYNAIVDNLEQGDWKCKSCGSENNLYIGRNGPFMQCGNKKCEAKHAIPKEVAEMAVRELKLTCEECGSPCAVAWGRYGPFVGCSKYPKCKHAVPWKELRKNLKGTSPG